MVDFTVLKGLRWTHAVIPLLARPSSDQFQVWSLAFYDIWTLVNDSAAFCKLDFCEDLSAAIDPCFVPCPHGEPFSQSGPDYSDFKHTRTSYL